MNSRKILSKFLAFMAWHVPWAIGALSVLSSLLIIIFWHLTSPALPHGDEMVYLQTALKQYQGFEDGLFSGLRSMFMVRDWKPTLVYSSHLFFLSLTQGQLVASIFLQSITLTLIALLLMYRVFLFNLPRPAALLGTGFVFSHTWLTNTFIGLNSENYEIIATLLALGAMLHLHKQPRSHRWSMIYSLSITLGLVYRPFEFGYHFLLDILNRLRHLLKNNINSTTLSMAILIVAPPLLFLAASVYQFAYYDHGPSVTWSYLLLTFTLLFVYTLGFRFLYKKDNKAWPYFLQLAPASFLFTFFYHLHGRDLIHWLYECTVGTLAVHGGHRGGRESWQVVWDILQFLYDTPTMPFVFIALILSARGKLNTRVFNPLICTSALLLFVPLFTDNTERRYYYPMAMVTLIITFTIFWSYKKWWAWIGRGVLLAALAMHLQVIFSALYDRSPVVEFSFWSPQNGIRGFSLPPDPQIVFAEKLLQHFEKFPPAKEDSKISIIRAKYPDQHFFMEPWGISALFSQKKLKYYIDYPWSYANGEPMTAEALLESCVNFYDYLVVGKSDDDLEYIVEPDTRLARMINNIRRREQLHTLPLALEAEFEVPAPDGMPMRFMVFRILKEKLPPPSDK